jgi:hypothetical protein
VDVLEHDDGGWSPIELAEQRANDLVRPGAADHELRELAPRHIRDVEQRSKGTRRQERVAGTPEDPYGVALLVAKAM